MLLVGFMLIAELAAADDQPANVDILSPDGSHPCVFATAEEVAAIRERMKTDQWTANAVQKVVARADAFLEQEVDLPHEGGQWSHWYTCKKDGGRLKAESPTRHVCTVCGGVYSGFPYDQVYISGRHGHWLGGIETLGLAYLFKPKPEYAQRAREILLEYASFYETLKIHNVHNQKRSPGARLFAQTLDEATTACKVCVGYDYLYEDPCFSEADRETIETHFLRPMAETILTRKAGISNWQSWHNAALVSIGLLLKDRELVDWAINDPKNGFLMQMRKSVLPSGMWYEGAPSYHWYALMAHLYVLEGCARSGMNFYRLDKVRSMFDGPLNQLYPDGTFPAINDSNRSSISSARWFYEIAYKRYGDPLYAQVAYPRSDGRVLLWGPDSLPEPKEKTLVLKTNNDEAGGLAVLRHPGRDIALFFNYSPQKGGHTHAAKLDMMLYGNGDERVVDPGRLPYGNPIHGGWYRQTIAHNTVVMNGQTQAHASCQLEAFETGENWAYVRATTAEAYPNATLDRTLLLIDNVVVDVYSCTASEDATFDLPLHVRGAFAGIPEGNPIEQPATLVGFGGKHGYDYLKNVRRVSKPVSTFTIDTGKSTSIHADLFEDTEQFTAEGFGYKPTTLLPMIIRRQTGKNALFVAVYQVLTKDEAPKAIECSIAETIIVSSPGVFAVELSGDVTLKVE